MKNLYDEIGEDFINKAITEFYNRAFQDPIIGHFFFKSNISSLIEKQIIFSSILLGCSKKKHDHPNKSLKHVHHPLKIREAHFNRRQKLFATVLNDLKLDKHLSNKWLEKENKLRSQIVNPHT